MKRISTRLAMSFLLVALLPTLPLSLVVRDLLARRFGPAIATPLETALEAGLAESRERLQERRAELARQATDLVAAGSIAAGTADARAAADTLLLDREGRVQPADSLAAFIATRPGLLEVAVGAGDDALPVERRGDALVARVTAPGGASAVAVQPLPRGMVGRAGSLTEGLKVLRAVRAEDGRVVLSFVGPFLLVYAVLIDVALLADRKSVV